MAKTHFKSYLFLLILNLILLSPAIFLEVRFLIPLASFLVIFNTYLFFFPQLNILKKIPTQHFTPYDPWDVIILSKELANKKNIKNVICYKSKKPFPFSVCFGNSRGYYIIISEPLLNLLSKKELNTLLAYYFHAIRTGNIFYLSLLSGLIYTLESLFFIINYPRNFFNLFGGLKKSRQMPSKSITVFILLIFGWLTKPLFHHLDKSFSSIKDKNLDGIANSKKLALLLWKINSLYRLEKISTLLYLAPIFITGNPFIKNNSQSLYPKIKLRVKNLTGLYPPSPFE